MKQNTTKKYASLIYKNIYRVHCNNACPLFSSRYLHSEECRVEEELLTAFKDFRPDLLEQAQSDRTLRRLEPPIVKLAKSLQIAGDDGDDYYEEGDANDMRTYEERMNSSPYRYVATVVITIVNSTAPCREIPPLGTPTLYSQHKQTMISSSTSATTINTTTTARSICQVKNSKTLPMCRLVMLAVPLRGPLMGRET